MISQKKTPQNGASEGVYSWITLVKQGYCTAIAVELLWLTAGDNVLLAIATM